MIRDRDWFSRAYADVVVNAETFELVELYEYLVILLSCYICLSDTCGM